ncbi:MAG: hypothetical protein V7696_09540 [Halioglobus sp.]
MSFSHTTGIAACLLVMATIVTLGPYSTPAMFLPDTGPLWYYWKLAEPNFWTHFSAWGLYILHQLGLWALIAWAQIKRPQYSATLHPVNIIALTFNLLFVGLHVVQTKFFYDGLAQDTSVLSSQFSVIFMLVFVLMMENSRRGLFFGHKIDFVKRPDGFIRRYHGYYFSWAVVYTFWFHPIEDNLGHILGTLYILLLLMQGSLFFTRFHRDRIWTVLLEVSVLFHGALVAYLTIPGDHWQMFLFGFLTLFVVTQMHGIGLGRKTRAAIVASYLLCVLFTYWGRGFEWLEVLRIPIAEFALVYLLAALAWTPWLVVKIRQHRTMT